MRDWKAFARGVAVGACPGTAIGLLAFFFLTSSQHKGMGAVLFLLVPIVSGFSIALVASADTTTTAALLTVLCSLVMLVALGKEGPLCTVLAFPIIAAGLGIGMALGWLVRRLVRGHASNQTTTIGILLLIPPLAVFVGERFERPVFERARTEVISDAVRVNSSPEHVWQEIQSIDSIQAKKPALMYVGLPIPQRCTMRGSGIGARRTCYFNVGYIEERVIAWNPPYLMGLAIDRTHMPGRHWLGFEHAEYRLQRQGNATILTRTTTITSHLHPAWYWRGFERLGVESEHRYILQDVVLRANSP